MAGQDPVNRTSAGFDDRPLIDPGQEADARERVDREAGYYASSRPEAWGEVFAWSRDFGRRAVDRVTDVWRNSLEGQNPDPNPGDRLSAEEANDLYGIEGVLTFDGPVNRWDAETQAYWGQRRAYRDRAVSTSELPMLDQLGAGLLGSLADPAQLPLWFLGPEAALGNSLRGAPLLASLPRWGRFATAGAIEGAAGGLLFESVNLPLSRSLGEDYSLRDASLSVLGGALFGGVLGGGIGGLTREAGATPRPARPPREVETLSPERRVGAFRAAMESVIADEPVDLGPMLRQADDYAGRPRDLARLDEAGTGLAMPQHWRRLNPDVAVTTRGTEIQVRYAIAELDDLVTSHSDDLFPDPAYPPELQPRQRERAAAQARNRKLEGEMNPLRLMGERGAESGAPIVSGDGVVESGNGRTIALRRSARGSGTEAYGKYRAALEAAGHDLTGFRQPVLVRVRTAAMDGEARVRLTRDMNADVTERYSAGEQAAADAEALSTGLLGLLDGGDPLSAANRPFVRRFIEKVAPDQMNALIAEGGGLSKAGVERLRAALTAKAYGDKALVETLFEAGDDTLKGIGRALADAAPAWVELRGAIARGEVPADMDLTANLIAAVDFVRHARQRGIPLAELVAQRLGQLDAFTGEAVSAETEAFLRAMFQTGKNGETIWSRPRAADRIAEGLRWLAAEARKVEPGPNLFGEVADATDARRLLDGLNTWFARDAEPDQHPLALAAEDAPAPAGRDVRGDGGQGPGGRRGPDAGQGAEGEGGGRLGDDAEGPLIDAGDPLADPELRQLRDDTEALIAREGLDLGEGPARDAPDTIRAAFEAAAGCILKGVP